MIHMNCFRIVWGPKPFNLGFIGAPIATAISFNLISICSIIYGVRYIPHTAWHPLSMRCFTSLGVLVQLGLAGVGQTASEWWSWELVGRKRPLPSIISMLTRLFLFSCCQSVRKSYIFCGYND
jgi:multidrug resistance protein, MATE family